MPGGIPEVPATSEPAQGEFIPELCLWQNILQPPIVTRRIAISVCTDTTSLGQTKITINIERDEDREVAKVLDAIAAIKAKFGDAPGVCRKQLLF